MSYDKAERRHSGGGSQMRRPVAKHKEEEFVPEEAETEEYETNDEETQVFHFPFSFWSCCTRTARLHYCFGFLQRFPA
jgi:hypothetical protein